MWKLGFTGGAGVFSVVFNPCSAEALAAMLEGFQLFGMGFSWGGYESLMVPDSATMQRTVDPWEGPGPLVHQQIGLEDPPRTSSPIWRSASDVLGKRSKGENTSNQKSEAKRQDSERSQESGARIKNEDKATVVRAGQRLAGPKAA